jgi:hypothetical protein
MRVQETRAWGDREPFDFFLSAFLSAARSVDYRLRHEQGNDYGPWRLNWNAAHAADDGRMKFISDDRNIEVHQSGSARQMEEKEFKERGYYKDETGAIEVTAPILPLGLGADALDITVVKPEYTFVIDGTSYKVTDICLECLQALNRMVADYAAAHP